MRTLTTLILLTCAGAGRAQDTTLQRVQANTDAINQLGARLNVVEHKADLFGAKLDSLNAGLVDLNQKIDALAKKAPAGPTSPWGGEAVTPAAPVTVTMTWNAAAGRFEGPPTFDPASGTYYRYVQPTPQSAPMQYANAPLTGMGGMGMGMGSMGAGACANGSCGSSSAAAMSRGGLLRGRSRR